jgi:hypothetical protein
MAKYPVYKESDLHQTEFRNFDEALMPATVLYHPSGVYNDHRRVWQGIPGIERTKNGRIYVGFYTGMETESPGNYVLLVYSDDDGETFSAPYLAILPPTMNVRCFDECLWIDPKGALHLYWAQSYGFMDGRIGVWESVCEDPDAPAPRFSAPRRLANGIMMNKPIVLCSGEWRMTCAVYKDCNVSRTRDSVIPTRNIAIEEETYSNIYVSTDEGESFTLAGHSAYEDRLIDEHMCIEKKDGSIWMLIRARGGIGEATSYDKGYTWTNEKDSGIGGPCARFCIRRLKSGRMLLINHHDFVGRNNLKAMVSEDEGETWKGFLLLDERTPVTYPDMTEDEKGNIYITYDFGRYEEREILMAKVTEADILAGEIVTPTSYLKRVVNRATGERAKY